MTKTGLKRKTRLSLASVSAVTGEPDKGMKKNAESNCYHLNISESSGPARQAEFERIENASQQ